MILFLLSCTGLVVRTMSALLVFTSNPPTPLPHPPFAPSLFFVFSCTGMVVRTKSALLVFTSGKSSPSSPSCSSATPEETPQASYHNLCRQVRVICNCPVHVGWPKLVKFFFFFLQIDKAARWGDLESDEEASSEEEESDEEDEEAAVREDDEASLADGLASVGGVSSLPSGLETPEVIDLRKAKAGGKPMQQLTGGGRGGGGKRGRKGRQLTKQHSGSSVVSSQSCSCLHLPIEMQCLQGCKSSIELRTQLKCQAQYLACCLGLERF